MSDNASHLRRLVAQAGAVVPGWRLPAVLGLLLFSVTAASPSSKLLSSWTFAAEEAPPAAKPKVTASVCSWREVEQRIRQYRGRPVIVDLWSTSCEPCLRELPELAGMQQQLGDRVVCLTVCLDYFGGGEGPSAELQRGALQVLRKHRVAAVNLICSTPDETVYQQLDLAAVPATLVYNAAGRLARRFDNESGEFGKDGFTYKRQILPFVRDLLAAGAE